MYALYSREKTSELPKVGDDYVRLSKCVEAHSAELRTQPADFTSNYCGHEIYNPRQTSKSPKKCFVVPSIVPGEAANGVVLHTLSDFFARLQSLFRIVLYDINAARAFTRIANKFTPSATSSRVTLKADALIVATALAHGATPPVQPRRERHAPSRNQVHRGAKTT